ncbi:MAG: sulfatase-like hydrolase/transferase [Planctomycetes bacterium]|nr:sulfatase-like hydrolase/transferase [Planctomycetota bacterium]
MSNPFDNPPRFIFCLCCVVVCLSARCMMAAEAATRPNILFIVSDDHRWDCVGAYGHPDVKTPAMDALAARGMVFHNTYCMGSMVGAVCSPSRTMLMTGRSLWRIPAPNGKADGTPSMGATFRNAGFATLFIGKQGNSYKAGNESFATTIYNGEKDHVQAPVFMADKTIDWLQEHIRTRKEPFFIYLGPPVPHDPRVAPVEYLAMYDPAKLTLPRNFMPQHPFDNGELRVRDELLAPFPRTESEMRRQLADYYAITSHLDFHMGRIVEELKRLGKLESTLIVYTSDHGLAVGGMHGLMGKQNLYEHNKSPLIIAGPGIPHGKTDALVYLYDLFPTLCSYAGLAIPEKVEGQNLLPVIRGEQRQVREVVFGAYRDCQRMIRDERWKLIEYRAADGRHTQLFDLHSDPDELTNLAADPAQSVALARLRLQLAATRREFNDPVDFEAPVTR